MGYIKEHMTTMIKETPAKKGREGLGFSVGSLVEGKVIARDRSALFLDLGAAGTGIIYGREFYTAKDAIKDLRVGDTVFAKVVEMENEDGYRELSLRDAARELNWQKLRDIKDRGDIISVKISGVNKGGLLTSVHGIAAFLPASQLAPENYPRVEDADKQKIFRELQKFVGKTMEVKILDLLAQENKLILSEKAKGEQAFREMLKAYRVGDTVEGVITGIADFGAFIKFPARNDSQSDADGPANQAEEAADESKPREIEGLIHISELDWQLVQNPAEVVRVGETMKARIVDISNNQVFLSLKSLKENPWEQIETRFKKDDIITGKVISLSPFGAFVEVLPKIRGLCHVSGFAGGREEMEKLLAVGETYDFQVVQIEPKEYRMSLKLAVQSS